MTNGTTFGGTIDLGDIDLWSFNSCNGDGFTIQIGKLTGSTLFTPQMRLYGRDGALLNTSSTQISRSAPATGTYTLVVADASGPLNGTGTYQLAGLGIKSGLTLCRPVLTGTTIFLSAPGGGTNATSALLTQTNIAAPAEFWTPVVTNQFDQFGVFSFTNAFNRAERERYFRLLMQ